MSRLTDVGVYPYSGWARRPWHENGDVDAAARLSAMVAAAIALELRNSDLQADSSHLRLFAHSNDGPDVVVTVFTDLHPEGFEAGEVLIPAGLSDLRAAVAARVIATAWRVALVELGRARGWTPAQVDELFERVDPSFQPTWLGPWKLSPSRRRRARLASRMEPDGFSRVWVEFADRRSDGVGNRTDEIIGDSGFPSQLPRYGPLTWVDETTVQFGRGLRRPKATDGESRIRLSALSGLDQTRRNPVGGSSLLPPTVRYEPPPSFRISSGSGPVSRRVSAYDKAADELNTEVMSEQWHPWWQSTGATDVFIPIWYQGAGAKIVVRLTGDHLSAVRYRPAETIPRGQTAAREAARTDLETLLARVRERFGLDEPPDLPPAE